MLSSTERDALNYISAQLSVDPKWLYDLIQAESGWNPQAANPGSSAKGLIQFRDSTAIDLGFNSSKDLISKYPTITTQLRTPVYNYLKQYAPYKTKQSLYLAVFYPAARYKSPLYEFPAAVKNNNPGIDTVQSYMDFVDKQAEKKNEFNQKGGNYNKLFAVLILSAGALIVLNKTLKN